MSTRNCDSCGSMTFVIDSRPSPEGYVKRRRQCSNDKCGLRFSTFELSYSEMRVIRGKLAKLADLIKFANTIPKVR